MVDTALAGTSVLLQFNDPDIDVIGEYGDLEKRRNHIRSLRHLLDSSVDPNYFHQHPDFCDGRDEITNDNDLHAAIFTLYQPGNSDRMIYLTVTHDLEADTTFETTEANNAKLNPAQSNHTPSILIEIEASLEPENEPLGEPETGIIPIFGTDEPEKTATTLGELDPAKALPKWAEK